jgi:hypothetical protein
MYNLLNSPNGPLGQAGMSNSSTRPQGIFSNAPASFNNFGRGLDSFTSSLADKAQGLYQKVFGGLFGGEGTIATQNPTPQGGVPSLFGEPGQPGNQGTPTQSNPIAMATAQGTNPVSNVMQQQSQNNVNPLTQSGMDGGGILSKFIQASQG